MRSQPAEYATTALTRALAFTGELTHATPPWGEWSGVTVPEFDFTVKHLRVNAGERTSLQVHRVKYETIIVLSADATGFVETAAAEGSPLTVRDGVIIHIQPGMVHRVTGPLEYLEISTADDARDTYRLADDYGRAG